MNTIYPLHDISSHLVMMVSFESIELLNAIACFVARTEVMKTKRLYISLTLSVHTSYDVRTMFHYDARAPFHIYKWSLLILDNAIRELMEPP